MFTVNYLLIILTTLLPFPTSTAHPSNPPTHPGPKTRPFTLVTLATKNKPLTFLRSHEHDWFSIGGVWDGPPPDWLRPIDVTNTTRLLNATIARYAARPGDEVESYGTMGPESSPTLARLDTRIVVKQWMTKHDGRNAAPLTNKDIVRAAQM
ncbi:MAG: hypothetical protein Q9182_002165 [Xanthomendoza sp. 2 TL-2023]